MDFWIFIYYFNRIQSQEIQITNIDILTVMQININEGSELVPQSVVKTPVKKAKLQFKSDVKTAESPNNPQLTIEDIDAEDLFNNFSKMVTVTETNEDFEQECPYRKIDFDGPAMKMKLNFNQTATASMKKKRNFKVQAKQCIKIKPFLLSQSNNLETSSVQNIPENDTLSPMLSVVSKDKKETLTTPKKKSSRRMEIENAAQKQDPFRDLPPR